MTGLLTTGEAAEAARRHPVTIRRALEAGELHGSQRGAGGRWVIREACLEAWLGGGRCEHQEDRRRLRLVRGAG
ncbi:MAG: helix-turn-helix domain-containing protein [Bifidobacteriaceae bacterium]|jgi:hypothetical protein|nr:helix-turn-helix domain-containing protein [Bifidobacteriaceae bacterium]